MTKKEYLSQAFYTDKRIKSKLRQLDCLRTLATTASQKFSDVPIKSVMGGSKIENYTVRIVDLETEIKSDIEELVRLKVEIQEAIRTVGNIEYETLLEMRYLAMMKWEDIATEMNYSSDYVYQIHRRALLLLKMPN